jgi:uncharacterized protein YacL
MKFLKDISKFDNINDYLPILNGALFADIIVLIIVYYTPYFNSKYLKIWYQKYRLSAIIADVLILVIGIILARFFYYKLFNEFNIFKFLGLVVGIQIIHDILFYIGFSNIPRGINNMMDLFKDYSKEVSAGAIFGDSFMIIIAVFASMFFKGFNFNNNIILLISLVYFIPYILYTK